MSVGIVVVVVRRGAAVYRWRNDAQDGGCFGVYLSARKYKKRLVIQVNAKTALMFAYRLVYGCRASFYLA